MCWATLTLTSCTQDGEISRQQNEAVDKVKHSRAIHSDSIVWTQKLSDDLWFKNKKKNTTTMIILSFDTNEELLKQTLIAEATNRIKVDTLERGAYIFELYDKTGLVHRQRFLKK